MELCQEDIDGDGQCFTKQHLITVPVNDDDETVKMKCLAGYFRA